MSSSFDEQLAQIDKMLDAHETIGERAEAREQAEREAGQEQVRQERLQARRDLEHRASRMDVDALRELGREKLAEKQLGHKLYENNSQQEQRESQRQAQRAALAGLSPDEIITRFKNGDLDELAGSHNRVPERITRADLKHMTAQQIVEANKTGKLDHLTGRN